MQRAFAIGALALALAAASSFPAHADAGATSQLSFRELEYQAPRDPLLGSADPIGDIHQTPQADIQPQIDALQQAVPAGTPRAAAEAALRKAGAHCKPANGSSETCSYFDVATRDEFVDDVHWNVKMALAGDTVSDMAVDRVWTRH